MNKTTNTALDDKRLEKVVDTQTEMQRKNQLATELGVPTISTDQKSATFTDVSAAQLMDDVAEGGLPAEKNVIQGFTAAIPWTEKASSFSITHDAKKTDQYGMLVKKMEQHTGAIMKTQDYHFGGIFRNGFDYKLSDNKPLFDKSHPLKSSGTTQNVFDIVHLPLSYSSLQIAEDVLTVRMKDHSGELITRLGTKKLALIVPDDAEIRDTAFQLAGVYGPAMKPSTDNNDNNYFKKYEGVKYDLYVCSCLGLSVAQAMNETTDTYGSTLSRYQSNWFLVDKDRLEDAFAKVILNDSEVIFEKTKERGLIHKYDFYSFFAYGVTSVGHFAVFGSKGDNSNT